MKQPDSLRGSTTDHYPALRNLIHKVMETYTALREQHERFWPQLQAVEQLRHNAEEVLRQVGLTYILGASVGQILGTHPKDVEIEDITSGYATALTAWADFLAGLEKLAHAWLGQNERERARELAACLDELGDKKRAESLQQAITLHQAEEMIKAQEWDEARELLEGWLEEHRDDTLARDLLCDAHYQPAFQAIQAKDWKRSFVHFKALCTLNPTHRDISDWPNRYPLLEAQELITTNKWDKAQALLEAWMNGNQDDIIAHDLLCETHYQSALNGIQAEDWKQVLDHFKALQTLNPSYRDSPELAEHYPLLAWFCRDIQTARKFNIHGFSVDSLVFLHNRSLLASSYKHWHSTVTVLEIATGRILQTFHAVNEYREDMNVRSATFSPDGRLLASATNDSYNNRSSLIVWVVRTGHEHQTLNEDNGFVARVAVSPEGRLLASATSIDSTVKVWEAATGKLLYTLEHEHTVTSLAFSHDGSLLASGGEDNTVYVWKVATGRKLYKLRGHNDHVYSVAFSLNNLLLASGSSDKTVKLWDIISGQLLCTLAGHDDYVTSVAFSPDGRLLASASRDGIVKVWATKA